MAGEYRVLGTLGFCLTKRSDGSISIEQEGPNGECNVVDLSKYEVQDLLTFITQKEKPSIDKD